MTLRNSFIYFCDLEEWPVEVCNWFYMIDLSNTVNSSHSIWTQMLYHVCPCLLPPDWIIWSFMSPDCKTTEALTTAPTVSQKTMIPIRKSLDSSPHHEVNNSPGSDNTPMATTEPSITLATTDEPIEPKAAESRKPGRKGTTHNPSMSECFCYILYYWIQSNLGLFLPTETRMIMTY